VQIPKAQTNKARQLIRRRGVQYAFIRAKVDSYGQPVLDGDGNPVTEKQITVTGIFHESGTNFVLATSEAAKIQTTPRPAILSMMESAKDIVVGDRLTVPPESGTWYKVTAVNDMGNVGLFADISLEVVADGLQF
jgi:hypothetical protein